MTDQVELLIVEDAFQISGRGLVVVPDFPGGRGAWKGGVEAATVIRPDGSDLQTRLHLHIAHFNIPDPAVPRERRWRIVPTFPDLGKDEVPIGSRIMVSRSVADAVRSK